MAVTHPLRAFSLATLLTGTTACGAPDEYAVELRFATSDLRARGAVLEVYLVPACGTLASTGATPSPVLRAQTLLATQATGPLGPVPPGRVGLYARARDPACAIIAAGCREHLLEADGTGVLTVTLTDLRGPGCAAHERCTQGRCTAPGAGVEASTCPPGTGDCDRDPRNGCEANLATSVNACGACGAPCSSASRGAPACVDGRCQLRCATGWGDCDRDLENGCETDLSSSARHCGACGQRCVGQQRCVAGACLSL